MGRTSLEYQRLFQSLLPKGPAWNRLLDSDLGKILHALSDEPVRIEGRSEDLVLESVPSTVNELLSEHEADYGITEIASTTAERIAKLKAKWVARGQQDPNFFITTVNTALGKTITITEFKPGWVGIMTVGQPCGDQWVLFRWLVNLDVNYTSYSFSTGFSSGFASIDKDDRSFVVNQDRYIYDVIDEVNPIKPGHTIALYDFYGPGFSRGFSWGFKCMPFNDATIPIESFSLGFSSGFASLGNYDEKYLVGGFSKGFNLGFNAHRGGGYSYSGFSTGFDRPS